jgi:hypothetical protein
MALDFYGYKGKYVRSPLKNAPNILSRQPQTERTRIGEGISDTTGL